MSYHEDYRYGDHSNLALPPLFHFDRRVVDTSVSTILNKIPSFLLINEGSGVIAIDDFECQVKRGSLLSLMPCQLFEIKSVDKTLKYNMIEYNLDLVNKMVKSISDANHNNRFLEDLQLNHMVQCNDLEMDALIGIFAAVKEELAYNTLFRNTKKKRFSEMYTISKIFEIITIFIRKINALENAIKKIKEPKKREYNLNQVFSYLYANMSKNLSIEEVAQQFFTSKSTLSRYLKKMTGFSYKNLIHEMKIAKCVDLLRFTKLTITEISEILGYVDGSHLHSAFLAQTGHSPSKFRQLFGSDVLIFNEYDENLFYKILNYINANYKNHIHAQNIAHEFGLSTQELEKIFMFHMERSTTQFLNEIRIFKACELLLNTDKSVLDIALEAGYQNTKTFVRNFHKLRGMSPSEFKKKGNRSENLH